jgi:CubicO group peptidase (beta-lactamase class C family)
MNNTWEWLQLARGVQRLLSAFDQPNQPGVVVGVAEGDDVVLRTSVGLASIEHQVALTPAHRFAVASVTKQFTSAAAILLHDQGLLDLDADARATVPELAGFDRAVTLRQMMDNTAGLRDYLELCRLGGVDTATPITAADLRQLIARQPTGNFAPGTRYLYSNSNFLLLGDAVARCCGETLTTALDRLLVAPVGMVETGLVPSSRSVIPRLATGYVTDRSGTLVQARQGFPKGGEGGLVSCLDDLLVWQRQLMGAGPLGPKLAAALHAQRTFTNGLRHTYANGLEGTDWRELNQRGHGGLWPGYRTQTCLLPDRKLAVVVLTNSGQIDPWLLARRVVDLRLDAAGHSVGWRLAPAEASGLTPGRYLDQSLPATITLRADGDRLVVDWFGGSLQLMAGADGVWRAASGTVRMALAMQGHDLAVELDAGARHVFTPVAEGASLPADLAGRYHADDIGATWTIAADGAITVEGPHVIARGWQASPVQGDCFHVESNSDWLPARYDVRIERTADRIAGLTVAAGRVKALPFRRLD